MMFKSTNRVTATINERSVRRALIIIAFAGLSIGLAAAFAGRNELARWIWAGGTIPVVAGLAISIVRDVLAGRMGGVFGEYRPPPGSFFWPSEAAGSFGPCTRA